MTTTNKIDFKLSIFYENSKSGMTNDHKNNKIDKWCR